MVLAPGHPDGRLGAGKVQKNPEEKILVKNDWQGPTRVQQYYGEATARSLSSLRAGWTVRRVL